MSVEYIRSGPLEEKHNRSWINAVSKLGFAITGVRIDFLQPTR